MSSAPQPPPRALLAVHGYGELGMWADAWEELQSLPPEDAAHPEIPRLRLHVLVGMKRWNLAAALAEELEGQGVRDDLVYLHGSYAIRRSRSLPEARAFLLRGAALVEECASIHFNLACYDCQLGDLQSARGRLRRAFELEPAKRQLALEDEDLTPLWPALKAGEI